MLSVAEAGVAEWTLEISGSDSALPPVAISAPWASGEAIPGSRLRRRSLENPEES